MPDRQAIEAGLAYEESFAGRWGGEQVVGSGNTPRRKLDVNGGVILASLKWTGGKSFRITNDVVREAIEGATGPGGMSADMIPAVVVRLDEIDEEWMMLRVSDMLSLLRGDVEFSIAPTKRQIKRAAAEPAFTRREDSE